MIKNIDVDLLNMPGEHKLSLQGRVGCIESILNVPNSPEHDYVAMIGHPHSLHGGTMNNKVVTTISRALLELGIITLRTNFRGVGQSEGEFDQGIGESEDVLHLLSQEKNRFQGRQLLLFGFSFGSYVMYRVACQTDVNIFISVAPAVNHGNFSEFSNVPTPWHVLVAGEDEIVPRDDVMMWHQNVSPAPILKVFEGTSHFFHGHLIELKQEVKDIISDDGVIKTVS